MRGDVLIQSQEVAGKWLVTVAVHESDDQREGPMYKQIAACLEESKNIAIVGAVQEWLRKLNA